MNILYHLDTFPKLSTSFITNEIWELTQQDHRISVFAGDEGSSAHTHREYNQLYVDIDYAESPTLRRILSKSPGIISWMRRLEPDCYARPREAFIRTYFVHDLERFIERQEDPPQLIHGHFASKRKFAAQTVAAERDIPFTLTTHAYDIFKRTKRDWTRRLIERSDRVITISQYNKNFLQNELDVSKPIDVVRVGIRPEKFVSESDSESNRLLTTSRLVEKKGLQFAVEAVAVAIQKIPDIEYHIIGDGPLKSELESLVAQRGLTSNVQLLGNVSGEKLRTELDAAQLFVLPCITASDGDRDGIPVALMEAMAMETPPVSTRISGIPELIDDGVHGRLVPEKDIGNLASAIVQLLDNDEERSNLADNARQRVEKKFNIHIQAEKLLHSLSVAKSQYDL